MSSTAVFTPVLKLTFRFFPWSDTVMADVGQAATKAPMWQPGGGQVAATQ